MVVLRVFSANLVIDVILTAIVAKIYPHFL